MPAHKKSDLTARIVEMRKSMSAIEIAKALGMTKQNVFYHLRKSRVERVDDEPAIG